MKTKVLFPFAFRLSSAFHFSDFIVSFCHIFNRPCDFQVACFDNSVLLENQTKQFLCIFCFLCKSNVIAC